MKINGHTTQNQKIRIDFFLFIKNLPSHPKSSAHISRNTLTRQYLHNRLIRNRRPRGQSSRGTNLISSDAHFSAGRTKIMNFSSCVCFFLNNYKNDFFSTNNKNETTQKQVKNCTLCTHRLSKKKQYSHKEKKNS